MSLTQSLAMLWYVKSNILLNIEYIKHKFGIMALVSAQQLV